MKLVAIGSGLGMLAVAALFWSADHGGLRREPTEPVRSAELPPGMASAGDRTVAGSSTPVAASEVPGSAPQSPQVSSIGSGEALGGMGDGQVPALLNVETIDAALKAMQVNGMDLSRPFRSRHVVMALDPAVADEIVRWARAQGFEVSREAVGLHGGAVGQLVNIDRVAVPDAASIVRDGRRIARPIAATPGTSYETWYGIPLSQ